jgi:hypothetical protein
VRGGGGAAEGGEVLQQFQQATDADAVQQQRLLLLAQEEYADLVKNIANHQVCKWCPVDASYPVLAAVRSVGLAV